MAEAATLTLIRVNRSGISSPNDVAICFESGVSIAISASAAEGGIAGGADRSRT